MSRVTHHLTRPALLRRRPRPQSSNRLEPADKKASEALRFFNGRGGVVGSTHSAEHGFASREVAALLTGQTAWPSAAGAPPALVEQWGAGGTGATVFVDVPPPPPPAFAATPRAADVPGRRSAVGAVRGAGPRGVAAAAASPAAAPAPPPSDLLRLPTGELIAPALGSPGRGRRPAAAATSQIAASEVGLTAAPAAAAAAAAPPTGRRGAVPTAAARVFGTSDAVAAGLHYGAAASAPAAPPARPSGAVAARGSAAFVDGLRGEGAAAALAPPPVAPAAHEAPRGEQAARFETATAAAFRGLASGGPAAAPPRRRTHAPPPPEIVNSRNYAYRPTAVY